MLVWIAFAAALFLALLIRHTYLIQDVKFALQRLMLRRRIQKYNQANHSVLDRFFEVVKAQPHKPFILFKDETFTYQDADELSNKAARAFLRTGLGRGDTVALFLGNEPVFLWLLLGLMKIGCCGALLNYNIRSRSLLHCLTCSGAKTLIAAEELQDAVDEVLPVLLEQQVSVYILTDRCRTPDVKSFKDLLSQASSEPVSKDLRSHLTLQSTAVYIYTSGTTGFPKAAVVSYSKMWAYSVFLSSLGLKSNDVVYISLPLYHTTGLLGVIATVEMGITVAIRSKFSASQFWDDCRKYNVTVIEYIGEILRYVCSTPKKLNDRNHKVRFAVGNGLKADVWREFISRFGNIEINEFYGSTEGNFGLLNYTGKIGAIGRYTFLHKFFFPYALIQCDVDTGEALRDSAGFCIEVAKGKPGLLVCKISTIAPFSGYAGDLEQTEKKRLHNVLKKGDMYFNTGDLLRVDEDNFIYFIDRVGDTFRWKGENVATTEVADVLSHIDSIKEANVYGVQIPGLEGRAGMAAITITEGQKFDSSEVFIHVEKYLPTYARPLFIRIRSSMEITGTFKHLKKKLVEEGFNPLPRHKQEELCPSDTGRIQFCCTGEDQNLSGFSSLFSRKNPPMRLIFTNLCCTRAVTASL